MRFLNKFFGSKSHPSAGNNIQPKKRQSPVSVSCPYCGTLLGKLPTRKTKCSDCRRDIYVRSKQTLFKSPLLTESQADAVDALKSFEHMGLNDRVFRNKHAELTANFGVAASVDDTLWSLYNDLIAQLASTNEFMQLSIIYSSMAVFLTKRGRNGGRMQIEASKMMLRDYAKLGVIEFEVADGVEPCAACKKLLGRRFKLSRDLIENPPLPPLGCGCTLFKGRPALCSCSYVAKIIKSSLGGVYRVNH